MASTLQRRKRSGGCEDGDAIGGEKKRPKIEWTPAEDAILVENVERHWKGSWKTLQEQTGLPHSSKACRLRWVNRHRPGLKSSEFTPDEEALIASLLDQLGQNWTDIATNFPGRSDSEVKNFWFRTLRPRLRGPRPLVVQNQSPIMSYLPEYPSGPFMANPPPFQENWFSDAFLGFPMVPMTPYAPPDLPATSTSLPQLVQSPTPPVFAESPELPSIQSACSAVGGSDEFIDGIHDWLYSDLPATSASLPQLVQPPTPPVFAESPELPSIQSTCSTVGGSDEFIDDNDDWLYSALSDLFQSPPRSTSQPLEPPEFAPSEDNGEGVITSGVENPLSPSQFLVDDAFAIEENDPLADLDWDLDWEMPFSPPSASISSFLAAIQEPLACNAELQASTAETFPVAGSASTDYSTPEDIMAVDLW